MNVRDQQLSKQSRLHGLFGYDAFISYTRRDGRHYAHELASRIMREHDFVVFLDDNELEVGQHLDMLLRQVRRSRMLVLLATPLISESTYVPQEVAAARAKGRRIVPIDLDKTLEQGRHGEALRGVLTDEKWEPETNALANGPSDAIVGAIVKASRGMRRRVQQRVTIGVAVLMFLGLAAFGGVVTQERLLAEQARQRAQEVAEVRQVQTRKQGSALTISRARDLLTREPSRARLLLEDPVSCPPEWRDLSWRLARAQCERTVWSSPAGWPKAMRLAFRPDGNLLAVLESGEVKELSPDGELLRELEVDLSGRVVSLHTARPAQMAVLHPAGRVTIHNLENGSLRGSIEAGAAHEELRLEDRYGTKVIGAAFLAGGKQVATLSRSGVRFWDLPEGTERPERRFVTPRGDGPSDSIVSARANPAAPEELVLEVTTDWEDGNYGASLFLLRPDAEPLEIDVRRSSESQGFGISRDGTVARLTSSTSMSMTSEVGFLSLKSYSLAPGESRTRELAEAIKAREANPVGRGKVEHARLGELGEALGLVYPDGAIDVLDPNDGTARLEWSGGLGPLTQVELHDRAGRIAVVNQAGAIHLLSIEPLAPRVTGKSGGRSGASGLDAFFRDGDDSLIHLWEEADLDTAAYASVLDRHTGEVRWTGFFGGFAEALVIDDLETEASGGWQLLRVHREARRSPPRVLGGEFLVGLGYSGLEVQDLRKDEERPGGRGEERRLEKRFEWARLLAVSPKSGEIALVRVADEVRSNLDAAFKDPNQYDGSWILETGPLNREQTAPQALWAGEAYPLALEYSPDGRWLAFADGKGPVRVWDTESRTMLDLNFPARQASHLSFLPDSSGITVWTGSALEFRSFSGAAPVSIDADLNGVTILRALSAERAALGTAEGIVSIIDLSSRMTHLTPGPARSATVEIDVSADGRTLLVSRILEAGGAYCTLADAEFGHEILELKAGPRTILAAAFLADGKGVVMVGEDKRFYVWRLPPEGE